MSQYINVRPKTTLLPVWPRDAQRLDTPALNDPQVVCLVSIDWMLWTEGTFIRYEGGYPLKNQIIILRAGPL